MHLETIQMQAVLSNYAATKLKIDEILSGKASYPLYGIIEDIFQAIIGFFGAEEWELCSEACSYLQRLEEYLKSNGENLKDYVDQSRAPYYELVRLLCRMLPVIQNEEEISNEELEKLKELSKAPYPIFPNDVFVVLRKHLKGRVSDDILKEIEVPKTPQSQEVPKITLEMQIATIELEFSLARLYMKQLLSGEIDDTKIGYYILKLTRDFSRAFELFFVLGDAKNMEETWNALEKLKKLSRERSLSLTIDPAVYYPLQRAEALHELWIFMKNSAPIPRETLSRALTIIRGSTPLHRKVLLALKEYFESQGYDVPEELMEALDKLPRLKEINYWEEYQKTLKEFGEKGRKFHEKAKEEWEKVERGEAEDLIGSLQEVIWNLSEGVVYNFAVRKFKLVKEAYEIFLKAHEFAKENDLFKTRLSGDVWLGKLKRVNLKWGNDIKWPEDYRVISNRIIRLTRIAEFMMWKRRIPEFLYANPYINLGADYEHNDPPLWALTRGLMMILNHNRSKGVLPGVELQEEVLNYALRLNLLWPEKTEVWECKDGICIVFRGELNEKAIKELKRNAWDDDIVFYHGRGILIGYSRKRKLGYACGKGMVDELIREALG